MLVVFPILGCIITVVSIFSLAFITRRLKEMEGRLSDLQTDQYPHGYLDVQATTMVEHDLKLYRRLRIASIIGLFGFLACAPLFYYELDPGEVAVVRNFGGSLAGSTQEPGLKLKAPWQEVIKYDVRNNTISFIKDASENYVGGKATGPQITVNDSGGASANVDIQVQYSIKPEIAQELYTRYGSQSTFVSQIVASTVRSKAREVAGGITTINLLTNRGEFSAALTKELEHAWEDDGVTVENVMIQEVRYPEAITSRYAEAQAAEVAKAKAQNDQETAKVEAETKLIEAEGEAAANAALTQSLSDAVLMERYINALKDIGQNGNLVVVPEGSMPMLNLPAQ